MSEALDLDWKLVESLTVREKQIYQDLCENLNVKEIAKKRDITPKTTRFHISNIYTKLDIPTKDMSSSPRLKFIQRYLECKPKKGCEL